MTASTRLNGFTQIWEQLSRVVFILLTCLIGMIAWQGKEMLDAVADHEKRIGVIEGSRYTVSDAREDTLTVLERIANLREWIEDNYPPAYLLDDVRQLQANQLDMQKMMTVQCQTIQAEIAKIREQIAKP